MSTVVKIKKNYIKTWKKINIYNFKVLLAECAEADDFSPAKSLMNMCFTYYYDRE